ncbi:HAMP domain-containing protein [Mucilaginibacter sp. Bleaf8]|uniref:sensor histidine kinase n=1 Tax=Mucilaginibacter sp. Bleaf8 TaxID=2834430 RepID=UPI001BCCB5E3|nr:HAMP domain-containing sensor histidine kinase [Mucilaginibacter sp. Bleaf8]MBS7564440.1 HAMP domain-containing protein [Mucilaginibacter sp. Bleaf8]
MKIKDRLSMNFTLISSGVMLVLMAAIYITFEVYFHADFYNRLEDRAKVAAQLYLKADEISSDSLNYIRERYLQRLPEEVIRIYDKKNEASFIKDNQQYWPDNIIEEVRRKKSIQLAEGERQTIGIFFKDNQGNFVIMASAFDLSAQRRLHTLTIIMLILFVVVSAALYFISKWFAVKSLEPIHVVIKQMQTIRASNLSQRVDEGNGKDEISELAMNFNKLLEHLENAFDLQHAFVINASHELRTPVTSLMGDIEVAMQQQRSVDEYQQILNRLLNDSKRLRDTVNILMEIARADRDYTRANLSPVPVDELLWELQAQWTAELGKGALKLDFKQLPENPDDLLINANKSLLVIAINNIISNAFKFSDNKPVTITLVANHTRVQLEIQDSGIGISPEEQRKIFTSFYRAPGAKPYPGSGIGLYVTEKIVQLFNGAISLHSAPGTGTTFVITFSH